MKIFNYDRETGEYLSDSMARPSPLEPGVFLIPAFATSLNPPDVDDRQAAVFANEGWLVFDDFRAVDAWEKATGRKVKIFELGPLPESLTLASPGALKFPKFVNGAWAEDKENAVAAMWTKIKAERDNRKAAGTKVEVEPGVFKWFHSDSDSRIQQLGLVIAGAAVPSVQWKTMDGTFVQMSQELAGKIFQAAAVLDTALFTRAEEHRRAMESCDNHSSYDYSTGWPEKFEPTVLNN